MWNEDNSRCPDGCFRPVGLVSDGKRRVWMSSDSTGEIWVLERAAEGTTTGTGTATGTSAGASATGKSGGVRLGMEGGWWVVWLVGLWSLGFLKFWN